MCSLLPITLDVGTLMFSASMVAFMIVGVLATLWILHRSHVGGIGFWAVGALALSVGSLLFLFQRYALDVLSIVGANTLVLVGLHLVAVGVHRFGGRALGALAYASMAFSASTVAVLVAFVLTGSPGFRVRVVLMALSIALALGTSLRGLPRAAWRTLPGGLYAGAVGVVIAASVPRVVYTLLLPSGNTDLGGLSSFQAAFILVYFAACAALLVSLVLLVPYRLHEREQALRRRLDLLYREMNHRVRNNLNVVHHLLDRARDELETSPPRVALAQSQSLVSTITAMHQALHQSSEATGTGALNTYLAPLARQVLNSFGQSNVRLDLDLQPAQVDGATLKNCGLMVNELVTNACKYAFNEMEDGVLTLRLETRPHASSKRAPGEAANGPQRITLTVADNGPGLAAPWGAGTAQGTGFGQALVDGLAADLGATLDVHSSATGTRVSWTFDTPRPEPLAAPARPLGSEKNEQPTDSQDADLSP
jgi:two-component sensor histidine kinase